MIENHFDKAFAPDGKKKKTGVQFLEHLGEMVNNALDDEAEGPWNDFYTKRIPIVAGNLKSNDVPKEVLDQINFDP